MAFRQIFKVSRKTFINLRAWADYDSFKDSNRTILDILKSLFITPAPQREETFEQSMQRLGLSESDVLQAQRNYYIYAIIFAVIGAVVILFGFYLLFFHRTFQGWLLAMAASALFLAQAFRYHFWYFQIKHRKLGCTFEEWRHGKPFDKDTMP